jgi:hypothetical protein
MPPTATSSRPRVLTAVPGSPSGRFVEAAAGPALNGIGTAWAAGRRGNDSDWPWVARKAADSL